MMDTSDLTFITEYIHNVLYFAIVRAGKIPKSSTTVHFFTTDEDLTYDNYYSDFGPLNLSCVHKFCALLNSKLKQYLNKQKIVYYTSNDTKKKANAAFLIGCYGILYLCLTPKDAYKPLVAHGNVYKSFQDVTQGESFYRISLLECLQGVNRAHMLGYFNFEDFDVSEYDRLNSIQGGDLNWILPGKFLAFIGPVDLSVSVHHPPEIYLDYFVRNNVKIVIRLNKKFYDKDIFTRVGIEHHDLFFPDGTCPPRNILQAFLNIAESTPPGRAIAVHCKAGLGRTGSLIGAYLIKHYNMTARDAIAWMRVCRPGSVIGHQQSWLEQLEAWLQRQGSLYRKRNQGDCAELPRHRYGVYSIAERQRRTQLEPAGSSTHCGLTQSPNVTTKVSSSLPPPSQAKTTIHPYLPLLAQQAFFNTSNLKRTLYPKNDKSAQTFAVDGSQSRLPLDVLNKHSNRSRDRLAGHETNFMNLLAKDALRQKVAERITNSAVPLSKQTSSAKLRGILSLTGDAPTYMNKISDLQKSEPQARANSNSENTIIANKTKVKEPRRKSKPRSLSRESSRTNIKIDGGNGKSSLRRSRQSSVDSKNSDHNLKGSEYKMFKGISKQPVMEAQPIKPQTVTKSYMTQIQGGLFQKDKDEMVPTPIMLAEYKRGSSGTTKKLIRKQATNSAKVYDNKLYTQGDLLNTIKMERHIRAKKPLEAVKEPADTLKYCQEKNVQQPIHSNHRDQSKSRILSRWDGHNAIIANHDFHAYFGRKEMEDPVSLNYFSTNSRFNTAKPEATGRRSHFAGNVESVTQSAFGDRGSRPIVRRLTADTLSGAVPSLVTAQEPPARRSAVHRAAAPTALSSARMNARALLGSAALKK